MCEQEMPTGNRFGAILLSRLTWENIEDLYASMKRNGLGPDWIRRCATVLSDCEHASGITSLVH